MLMLHINLQLKSTHSTTTREERLKMENQTELPKNIDRKFGIYQKLIPDVGQAYDALPLEGIRQA